MAAVMPRGLCLVWRESLELCCRQISIEMLWILYILLKCRVNNSTQSNSQESVHDLLLVASSA